MDIGLFECMSNATRVTAGATNIAESLGLAPPTEPKRLRLKDRLILKTKQKYVKKSVLINNSSRRVTTTYMPSFRYGLTCHIIFLPQTLRPCVL